jgi:hypothetical protein
MKKLMLVAAVALVLPSAALAGGPSSASIQGPAFPTTTLSWNGQDASHFWQLAEAAGFFPAAFGRSPDPTLRQQPEGDLGPRYTITWVLPTSPVKSTLHQDIYPYAKPRPLTYMARGQSFELGSTHGGWYVAGAELTQALVSVGLPAQPATGGGGATQPRATGGSRLSTFSVAGIATAGTMALALALLVAIRVWRRPRSTATP